MAEKIRRSTWLKRPKNPQEVRIKRMLLTALYNASRSHLKELQSRCLRSVASLRQWSHMLLPCLPWRISQCGGGYFMHQILLSGRMFWVLQAFFSLFQCRMASLSKPFPRLTLSSAARGLCLGNDTLNDINADNLLLVEFSHEAAIDLWWDMKT